MSIIKPEQATKWFDSLMLNDCEADERLDCITRDAANVFDVPIAMINLVTENAVIFKSCVGRVQADQLKPNEAFCTLAAASEEPLVVVDATHDDRFKDFAIVTGPLHIRSYLGKSLRAPDGSSIGTLCLLDTKPRSYSDEQIKLLISMAEMAEEQLAVILLYT
jgi:GAF domain-containing protein